MGRWEPDAGGRLRQAAMELFADPGYEQTTVAAIAERAGVTARTFFRYFADKREVLFAGSHLLQEHLLAALEGSPASATPLEVVGIALDAAADVLVDREFSRERQAVIDANAELQERELRKLSSLAAALAAGLRARGVSEPEATLAAETGLAIFRVAFRRWVDASDAPSLSAHLHESFDQLGALFRV